MESALDVFYNVDEESYHLRDSVINLVLVLRKTVPLDVVLRAMPEIRDWNTQASHTVILLLPSIIFTTG